MTRLLLEFCDNGKAHDDLHLWLPGYSRTADTYYFAIDRGLDSEDESSRKAARVLCRLLVQWRALVAGATGDRAVYLPYDFSDEYTGCLKCECVGDAVSVTPGFSRREGWSVSPCDIRDYASSVSDFGPDAAAITVSKDAWLVSIEEACQDADAKGRAEANQTPIQPG